jgi:nitrate reductase cytochrome c-type subunit
MKNLVKISLLLFVFGMSNNVFSQEIKKSNVESNEAKKKTYDSKKNKPLKKEKVDLSKMQAKRVEKPQIKKETK